MDIKSIPLPSGLVAISRISYDSDNILVGQSKTKNNKIDFSTDILHFPLSLSIKEDAKLLNRAYAVHEEKSLEHSNIKIKSRSKSLPSVLEEIDNESGHLDGTQRNHKISQLAEFPRKVKKLIEKVPQKIKNLKRKLEVAKKNSEEESLENDTQSLDDAHKPIRRKIYQ
jgi:DNA repair ATPase RecN